MENNEQNLKRKTILSYTCNKAKINKLNKMKLSDIILEFKDETIC